MFGLKRRKDEGPQSYVSVVMKRQLPIRRDEEPRSWLGGLPQMPDKVAWPRAEDGTPLAFAAQICCSELPKDLWNGLGPRSGWLLLFVEPEQLESETDNDLVKAIHINELGPERQPPEDMPFWRFQFAGPKIASDIDLRLPKHWRKWPVDLVEQRYRLTPTEWGFAGPATPTPQELYGAPGPEHGYSLCAVGTIKLDRPLTWRGAAMALADQCASLHPDRNPSSHVLAEAPEPDQEAFNEELRRRLDARPEMHNQEPGYYWGQMKAREEETARLKAERRSGWIERAFDMQEREERRWAENRQKNLDELEAARAAGDQTRIAHCEGYLSYYDKTVEDLAENRAYLNEELGPFRSPEGEAAVTLEIEANARDHGEWVKRQAARVQRLLDHVLQQDLDATLPAAEWERIQADLGTETFEYAYRTHDTRVLVKRTDQTQIDVTRNGVLVEELLDFYAAGDPRIADLPEEVRQDFEARLRKNELVHRLGGHRDPAQGDIGPDDPPLLMQLASDDALGWLWADLGYLYVILNEADLHRSKFHKSHAWLEGG